MKRGLLLHGPPGTRKSLTVAYLLGSMPERAAIISSGRGMSSLNDACALARAIQPATIVIDDVDLIAESRSSQSTNSVLFDLLEQMDGIDQDADVLFLLTTNRPEILEPAISERPGRIDQAIEIPLPDEDCRKRLFELYSDKLPIQLTDVPQLVGMTDGTSAAFVRELFRRSALLALEEGDDVIITDEHLQRSFVSMRASQFTRRFLADNKLPVPM